MNQERMKELIERHIAAEMAGDTAGAVSVYTARPAGPRHSSPGAGTGLPAGPASRSARSRAAAAPISPRARKPGATWFSRTRLEEIHSDSSSRARFPCWTLGHCEREGWTNGPGQMEQFPPLALVRPSVPQNAAAAAVPLAPGRGSSASKADSITTDDRDPLSAADDERS
jgi:hypothetical protein